MKSTRRLKALLRQVPIGTPLPSSVDGAMQRLGFVLRPGLCGSSSTAAAPTRDAEPHLSCSCAKNATGSPAAGARASICCSCDGRLSNVLVNIGRFC